MFSIGQLVCPMKTIMSGHWRLGHSFYVEKIVLQIYIAKHVSTLNAISAKSKVLCILPESSKSVLIPEILNEMNKNMGMKLPNELFI